MLVLTRIWTKGLSEREKSENFLSKALPLSHGGIKLYGDKSTRQFPISKMLLLNIGHELTYHYNECQNAKNGYILKTNRGNQEKNIHILCIYVYVSKNSLKMASELKVIAIVL